MPARWKPRTSTSGVSPQLDETQGQLRPTKKQDLCCTWKSKWARVKNAKAMWSVWSKRAVSNVNSYARYLVCNARQNISDGGWGQGGNVPYLWKLAGTFRTCNYCLHAIFSPPFSLIFHNDFIHIIFTAFRREIVPASYRFTQERTTRVPMLATVKLVSKTNKNITFMQC